MKAILIDAEKQEVIEVEVKGGDIQEIYDLLGCECFTVATYVPDTNDAIYVDDEGLLRLRSDSKFFEIEGGHQPFVGNGLIIGTTNTGSDTDAESSVEDIRRMVKFRTLSQVQRMYC